MLIWSIVLSAVAAMYKSIDSARHNWLNKKQGVSACWGRL
jgi:hypothetical protein